MIYLFSDIAVHCDDHIYVLTGPVLSNDEQKLLNMKYILFYCKNLTVCLEASLIDYIIYYAVFVFVLFCFVVLRVNENQPIKNNAQTCINGKV